MDKNVFRGSSNGNILILRSHKKAGSWKFRK